MDVSLWLKQDTAPLELNCRHPEETMIHAGFRRQGTVKKGEGNFERSVVDRIPPLKPQQSWGCSQDEGQLLSTFPVEYTSQCLIHRRPRCSPWTEKECKELKCPLFSKHWCKGDSQRVQVSSAQRRTVYLDVTSLRDFITVSSVVSLRLSAVGKAPTKENSFIPRANLIFTSWCLMMMPRSLLDLNE